MQDKPRLYNQIKTFTSEIGRIEVKSGIEMPVIVFFVLNEYQRDWIETNILFEMQDRFAEMAGLELLTLHVEIIREENQ